MARKRRRLVLVALSADEFDVLAATARSNEREPEQQARWMLRDALGLLDEESGVRSQESRSAGVPETEEVA
jgi:hypothetical protein